MSTIFVSSGVTSSGLTEEGIGSTLEVLNGGFANSTTVIGGGALRIDSGGSATDSFISSGGTVTVLAGGSADHVGVSSGGVFNVQGTVLSNVSILGGGTENVSSGGIISGTISSGTGISGGTLNLLAGASAAFVGVSSGSFNVYGEVLSDVSVFSGGIENIYAGGVATGQVGTGTGISGGIVNVSSGGELDHVTAFSGGVLNILAGAATFNISVSSGGAFNVHGAVLSNVGVFAGGVETIFAGGTVSDTGISGGTVNVSSGGSIDFTTVFGGSLNVSAGGSASVYLSSGGVENVSSGGLTDFDSVFGGGGLNVSAGGIAHDVTLSGGILNLAGTATSNVTISNGGVANLLSGGLISASSNIEGATVVSGGTLDVQGLTVNDVWVQNGGVENVSSGGVIKGTISGTAGTGTFVDSGGTLNVLSGGTASMMSVLGTLNVLGEVASNVTVQSGGLEVVSSGGVVTGVTSSGTAVSGTVDVQASGSVDYATVFNGGNLNISAGGTVDHIVVSSGGTLTVAGTVLSNVAVYSGGVENVRSGGVVTGVTSSGTAISGGIINVSAGAELDHATAYSGGVLNLSAEATAHNISVSSGGKLNVAGVVTSAVTVFGGGTETVSSGGSIGPVTLSGGELELKAGSVVNGGISFGGSGGTLVIDGTTMPVALVSGISAGDSIDLAGVAFASGGSATLTGGTELQVVENGVTYTLNLNQTPAVRFSVQADATSGTLITAHVDSAPIVSATSVTATLGETSVAATNLFTVTDPDGDTIQQYALWDTQGNGHWVINGVVQVTNQEIDVTGANLSGVSYVFGSAGTTDTLSVRASDGTLFSAWQNFTATAFTPISPSVTVTGDPTANRGQSVALSNLVTVNDPDSVGYTTLELWDSNGTVGGGQFVVNGVAQTGGHEIDVSPANVANTVFDVGTLGGGDTLYARLLEGNGTLTAWQTFGVSAPTITPPSVTVTGDPTANRGQSVALSNLVTVNDPDSVGYTTLELWDSNGTVGGGQFVVNGVAQTGGHEIDVSPANVANTVFDVGTLGGSDTLYARLLESNGTLTAWQTFGVSAPTITPPSVTVTGDPTANRGQSVALSSLVTVNDPDSVGYTTLELWDSNGTVGGGQFVVNGVAQTGGHEIDVSPANVANTVFDVGTLGGSDTLYARLLESNGTLTAWQTFGVSAPTITPPSVTVTGDPTANRGQSVALSNLVTVNDPDSVGYTTLELWDSNGTVGGGQFVVNGVAQTGGHEIDVSPANVANTVFDVGTLGGSDTLYARLLESNGTLTAWQTFGVTAPTITPPSVTVTGDPTANRGQSVALSNLVTVNDPDSVGYTTLELWDSNGTVGGGQFVVNGVAQTGGHEIDVSPANVANTVFDVGTAGGTDTLWAQLLEANGTLSGWQQFSVTAPTARTPTVAVNSDASATQGQTLALSSLVTVLDPDSVGYQTLQLWDTDGTAAGGEFLINGVAQTGGHAINVPSGATVVFDAGTSAGTDTLWAQLIQSNGTASGWEQFTVTVPTPSLTVQNDTGVSPGQSVALSSLVTISDPGNVGYQTLELWDSNGTAATGQFVVNGVAQTGGHEIDVSPANAANVVFDEGTSGSSDTLWARLQLNNGTLTAWQQFSVVDPVTVANGATLELPQAYAGEANFAGNSGTLQLDQSTGFSGTVAGLGGQDQIDLRDIGFGTTTSLGFAENNSGTGGTLSVSDGTHLAQIALLGQYAASSFATVSDGHGGTAVQLNPEPTVATLTQPNHV